MTRIALIFMIGIALAFATPARAGEPTPSPEPEPTATATPSGSITIRVVHDLNGDGVEQDEEPGLAGWQVYAGCGDALLVLTTDADGYASHNAPDCFRVNRRFGWAPTTPTQLTIVQLPDREVPVRFLLQDLGPDVMEIFGEPIVAGLPAESPSFSLAAPYAGSDCVEPVDGGMPLVVAGSGSRTGCPATGDVFTIVMNGVPAADVTFVFGKVETHDLVVGGDSMRLILQDVDGAVVITGVSFFNYDCAVIRPVEGFVPEGTVRVFVLSHEAKSGCAAPGNTIIFTRGGNNLFPFVPWEAGTPEFSPPLQLMERIIPVDTGTDPDIVPPETGSAGLK